jgi:spoIIIJ-associated protein
MREHRPVSLDAMSALERKVIHEHLKSRHDVETYSEGQEPARRLVVAPLVD